MQVREVTPDFKRSRILAVGLPGRCAGTQRSGFTLLELLVVIAILAILAALGSVVYRQAMYGARKVESISKLRNYGTAIHAYAAEHGGLPGPLWSGQQPVYTGSPRYLATHLRPYFKDSEPEPGSIPDLLVTSQYRAWLESQDSISGNYAYHLSSSAVTRDSETLNLFGYPDPDSENQQANWVKLLTEAKQSATQVMYETAATSRAPNRAPKPGVTQNYLGKLMLDGHEETVPYQ